MKLYIIGNGFDLAHGLKTKYSDYRLFIKESNNKDWDIILEYYPDNHPFWHDIESKICIIDRLRFMEAEKAKRIFGINSDLDALLKAIHGSFEQFIINVEKSIDTKHQVFTVDKNALFLTFNYTTTLETLYGAKHVVHLHNTVEEAIMKHYFRIQTDDCIIGHSPIFEDFQFYSDTIIGSNKDYISFRNKTTKPCKKMWEKFGLFEFFLQNQNSIDEVVFYGFSFSKTDKYYMERIFLLIPSNKTKYTVYYHLDDSEIEEDKVWSIKMSIAYAGGSFEEMNFINSSGVKNI